MYAESSLRLAALRAIRPAGPSADRELESRVTDNQHPKPFVWVKTADQILDSIRRFSLRASLEGH